MNWAKLKRVLFPKTMDALPWMLLVVVGLSLGGCSISRQESFYDDAYFGMEDARLEANAHRESTNRLPKPEVPLFSNEDKLGETSSIYGDTVDGNRHMYRDEFGNLIITNGYDPSVISFEDYHDYSYSSRLRRFGSNATFEGYYDPWYTNHYWYSGNMNYWGTSIYQTYPWWYQPGGPGNAFGWGWGYAWAPFAGGNAWGMGGYNPWMGYSGWGTAWNGFYSGSLYYNSLDQNVHYGKRNFGRPDGGKNGQTVFSFSRVMEDASVKTARRNPLPTQNPDEILPVQSNNEEKGTIKPSTGHRAIHPANTEPSRSNQGTVPEAAGTRANEIEPSATEKGQQSKYDNRKENGMLKEDVAPSRSSEVESGNRNTTPSVQTTPERNANQDNRSRRGIFGEGSRSGIFRSPSGNSPQPAPNRTSPGRTTSPSTPNRQNSSPPPRSNQNSGGNVRSPR